MPTPLVQDGILYVLGNNGVFDAYELATGKEIYRQRIPHLGSGFSASPIAADGRIYLSNEDGEMIVIRAGREFAPIATNSMGELLMATPALSEGVMYVRSERHLFAVGRPPGDASEARRQCASSAISVGTPSGSSSRSWSSRSWSLSWSCCSTSSKRSSSSMSWTRITRTTRSCWSFPSGRSANHRPHSR
jgi:outer membrane protein assembly factor BamB